MHGSPRPAARKVIPKVIQRFLDRTVVPEKNYRDQGEHAELNYANVSHATKAITEDKFGYLLQRRLINSGHTACGGFQRKVLADRPCRMGAQRRAQCRIARQYAQRLGQAGRITWLK
jgi:hypothetical protein